MEVWHVTLSAAGRHPLFPVEATLRHAVRCLARIAGTRMALFCIVDEHMHLVVVCPRREAGRLAQSVEISLGRLAAGPFQAAHFEPVGNRRHLSTLVEYLVRQPIRHYLPGHPALWTGSCFCDLVGARFPKGCSLRIREVLPRFHPDQTLAAVGLGGLTLRTTPDRAIREQGGVRLAEAAGAALAARPELRGKEPSTVLARAATARLAALAGIPCSGSPCGVGATPPSPRWSVRSCPW